MKPYNTPEMLQLLRVQASGAEKKLTKRLTLNTVILAAAGIGLIGAALFIAGLELYYRYAAQ